MDKQREDQDSKNNGLIATLPGEKEEQAILFCSAGLILAFFMPWISFFGMGISGYNISQLGSYGYYAWAIPVLAALTAGLGLFHEIREDVAFLTGLTPLAAIGYAFWRLTQGGNVPTADQVMDFILHAFSFGAWLTVVLSIGILIGVQRMHDKAKKSHIKDRK